MIKQIVDFYDWKPERYGAYYALRMETGTLRAPSLAELGIQLERPDYLGVWGNINYFLSGGISNGGQYNLQGEYVGLAPRFGAPDWIGGLRNPGKIISNAESATNVVPKTKDVLGHIFRNVRGHVNPTSVASQNRYINLFENVANNSKNLNPNVLTGFQRTIGGFQGYSQTFRNGNQVWIQTRNGKIINAGVNLIPK